MLHRLLQKEPARRFPSAGEVIRELEKASPDPQRRMMALAKVAGMTKRLSQSGFDSDRPGGATKRLGPDLGSLATQPAARVPAQVPLARPSGSGWAATRPPDPP